ncbi:TRAP transporter small permease [Agrobacterium sp. a22-2]|uniref:TRAP transporter small permease n=1 Tax=Agrobacterium sp. a22-2 TaxID=2283840 RepID=UPI0034CE4F5E
MQAFLDKTVVVLGWVSRIALYLAGLGLVLMTVFIGWQVFGRFVLNNSPSWTEPMAILLMSWFIFLGAAVGVREGYHMSFEVLLYVLPDGARRVLFYISDLAVLGFGAGMAFFGWQMAAKTWQSTIPGLGYSGGVAFLALITGGLLITLFTLERIALRASGAELPNEANPALPTEV